MRQVLLHLSCSSVAHSQGGPELLPPDFLEDIDGFFQSLPSRGKPITSWISGDPGELAVCSESVTQTARIERAGTPREDSQLDLPS